MKRLCLFCEHFVFLPEQVGYSEYTPGTAQDMYCALQWWDSDDVQVFRETMLKAVKCPDFCASKDAIEMGFTEAGNEKTNEITT